jgi:hypothetical protein
VATTVSWRGERVVLIAQLAQVAIPTPSICADGRANRYIVFDECSERINIATGTNGLIGAGDNAEAKTAGIDEFLDGNAALVDVFPFRAAILSILARSDLGRVRRRPFFIGHAGGCDARLF